MSWPRIFLSAPKQRIYSHYLDKYIHPLSYPFPPTPAIQAVTSRRRSGTVYAFPDGNT